MENIILKYLQNQASDSDKKELLDWLNASHDNLKKFHDYADLWALSSDTGSETDIYEALDLYRENIGTHPDPEKKKRSIIPSHILRIAAGIAIIFVSTTVGYLAGNYLATDEQNAKSVIMNQYAVGKESKSSVRLPDGTQVWLNADSKLKYPEVFADNQRVVEIEGEAYFEVAKNDKQPFRVLTNNYTITVVGTSFNIRNHCNEEKIEATLLTGEIWIEDTKGQEFKLRPNQKITYDKLSKGYSISEVLAENYILWKKDQLDFENEKLSTILEKLKYWYGTEISYMSDIDKDTRLSLRIRKENKEEMFRLLDLIAPIESTIDPYTGHIKIKKK